MVDRLNPRSTGLQYRAHQFVPMPDKVRGKHRWIVIATHTVTAEGLRKAQRGEDTHLDMETLVGLYAGCIDCEQVFPAAEPCPAGDEWAS